MAEAAEAGGGERGGPSRSRAIPRCHAIVCLLAGALAWGTSGWSRGAPEAMAFGAVAGLAVLCLVGSRYPIRSVARAAGLMAVSMTFGAGLSMKGSLDLIHGSGAGGSGDALVWGMAGLFLKAGLWMAMAGAFLGAGLGRRRCGPWDVLLPYLAVLPLWHLGIAWLNRPFDPAAREFPAIYFSARTVPEGEILPESWGGMLLALAGAILCCAFRRNALPAILALYGFLAGGFGAVLGQAVPALLARNPGLFRTGPMEGQPLGVLLDSQDWAQWGSLATGAAIVLILGAGIWCNQGRLFRKQGREPRELPARWELLLWIPLAAWMALPLVQDAPPWLENLLEQPLLMAAVPLAGLALGRTWGLWWILPVALLHLGLARLPLGGGEDLRAGLWTLGVPLALAALAALALSLRRSPGGAGAPLLLWAASLACFAGHPWSGEVPGTVLFQCLAFPGIVLALCLCPNAPHD